MLPNTLLLLTPGQLVNQVEKKLKASTNRTSPHLSYTSTDNQSKHILGWM